MTIFIEVDVRDVEKLVGIPVLASVTKDRYNQLLVAEERLKRLEAGGVDNWEWYHESLNPKDQPSMEEFEEAL